jgi:hypothetical protein
MKAVNKYKLLGSFHLYYNVKNVYRSTPIKRVQILHLVQAQHYGWYTEKSGFDSQQEQEMFLFFISSRHTLRPINHYVQRFPGSHSSGNQRPEINNIWN